MIILVLRFPPGPEKRLQPAAQTAAGYNAPAQTGDASTGRKARDRTDRSTRDEDSCPGNGDTLGPPARIRDGHAAQQRRNQQNEQMKDFAAIDFETANRHPSSVCSVGIVVVRDGKVSDKFYSLIRPRPNYYSQMNSSIHGLVYHDTVDAPLFPEVWKNVVPLIGDLPLAAHNSPFDEACLKAAFDIYGMPYPGYVFHCTCRASRRTFGRQLPNHRLHTVAARCGFLLENHHNALADAEACAAIALKIL